MSKEALAKVVERAISDAGFRRQLSSDPAGALRGFNLTTDEMSAIRTGDAGRLSTLGIDQRMSKAFSLGGAVAATRMAKSDLGAANPSAIDDGTAGGSTIIPHDPESTVTADTDGGAATRSAINDDPDGFLAANAQTVRVGDNWKFTDRVAADATGIGPEQHAVLSSDGLDPYASARDIGTGEIARDIGTGEVPFTASAAPLGAEQHAVLSSDGLDPYASARDIGTGEIARDIGTGEVLSTAPAAAANYPAHDGLAGPSALESARAGDDWARAGTGLDDSARAGTARLDDAVRPSGASAINDDPDGFLAANARADTTGVPAAEGTNYIDDSESYLSQVGYDSSASSVNAKATWSGDENAGPTSVADDDASGGSGSSEGGPNLDH